MIMYLVNSFVVLKVRIVDFRVGRAVTAGMYIAVWRLMAQPDQRKLLQEQELTSKAGARWVCRALSKLWLRCGTL